MTPLLWSLEPSKTWRPSTGLPWLQGPRCRPPSLEQRCEGRPRQRPVLRGCAAGGARGAPAGGGGGAKGARPGRSGKEALGCTISLVPAGAALPPPSLLFLRFLFHLFLFHLFVCIHRNNKNEKIRGLLLAALHQPVSDASGDYLKAD